MKGLLTRGLAVAALVAAIVVPGASAKSGARVNVALLPLPASAIDPAAKSLALQYGSSGVVSNGGPNKKIYVGSGLPVTPNRSFVPTGPVFAKLGRVTGYTLDYGLGASGGAGIDEVSTSVDLYKTSADAKKGLAFWKSDDRRVTQYAGGGLAIAIKAEKVAPVGRARFAFLVGYSAPNIFGLIGADEQFTEGRYEADVTVWAPTVPAATRLASTLAKRLDERIKRALTGRLHAKPVKLPAKPKAGPAPGGPDLAPLGLKTTDVDSQATAFTQNYWVGPPLSVFALSEYRVLMLPAGRYDFFDQDIEWYPTANQASFMADFEAALFGKYSLDLSSLGDGARGALANDSSGGIAELVFSSGRLHEFIYFAGSSAIPASEVQNIAHTAASYINAAGLGS